MHDHQRHGFLRSKGLGGRIRMERVGKARPNSIHYNHHLRRTHSVPEHVIKAPYFMVSLLRRGANTPKVAVVGRLHD